MNPLLSHGALKPIMRWGILEMLTSTIHTTQTLPLCSHPHSDRGGPLLHGSSWPGGQCLTEAEERVMVAYRGSAGGRCTGVLPLA